MEKLPPIVFCCNRSFFAPLSVAIASICENASRPADLRFIIAASDVSEEDQHAFAKWVGATWRCDCRFFHVAKEQLSHFPVTAHYTVETYMRFFVLKELGKSEAKALYLDADTMALGNVVELLEKDFAGNLFYAVENPGFDRHRELGIPEGQPYFNAGLMFVDLSKWTKLNITDKVVSFIEQNPAELFKLVDQDALNAVLYDSWKMVGPEWNFQRKYWHALQLRSDYSQEDIAKSRRSPQIVHFNGRSKPWATPFLAEKRFGQAYLQFADWSPWGFENVKRKPIKECLGELLRYPAARAKRAFLLITGKAI